MNPVTIPPGYRELKVGETLLATDFWRQDGGAIKPVIACADEKLEPRDFDRSGFQWLRKLAEVPPTNPPAGYRWLKRGEKVQVGDALVWFESSDLDPISETDGYLDHVVGSDASDLGDVGRPFGSFARKLEPAVNPGEGYRLLSADETIALGDEYHLNVRDRSWTDVSSGFVGRPASEWLRNDPRFVWRRKLIASVVAPTTNIRPAVYPGFGYRLLNENDTIRATDQFWSPGIDARWTSIGDAFVGYRATDPIVKGDWRRKRRNQSIRVYPLQSHGSGYRLLDKGETLQSGDEYCARYGADAKWKPTQDVGAVYGVRNTGLTYRRKQHTVAANSTIRATAYKPTPTLKSHTETFPCGTSVAVIRESDGSVLLKHLEGRTGLVRGIRWSPRVLAAVEKGLRLTR